MFEELGLLGNAVILVAFLFILDRAINLTLTNSIKVAGIAGFAKTTVGFILIAFCTSLPALFVSLFSALNQDTIGIAIGNVLGSNIVNICLIPGICFLLATLKKLDNVKLLPSMTKEEIGSLYFGLFVGSIIPLSLIYIGYASRFIGAVLLAIFAFYTYLLSKVKNVKGDEALDGERRKIRRYILLALLGVAVVMASSYFIVDSSALIASWAGLPTLLIGSTVVAFGTSIPVLIASIRAVRSGHLDLALGNIVGSCFINTTCILGATLIVSSLRMIDMGAFSNLVMFSVITNLFLWYFISIERIGWREGAILLFVYILFLTISFGGYRP